jgi:L-ascorbate metabolism protein UlaG (beta-lactamase superfamily)
MAGSVTITLVGGPTVIVELDGVRLMTDPTFDPPGELESRPGVRIRKLRGPAIAADGVGRIDAVLLSHDQHVDNLDASGRASLRFAGAVLTTPAAACRLCGAAAGLEPWGSVELPGAGGAWMRVTAVPARHGPDGIEPVMGDVTGFVLSRDGFPTVYVSGDNASLDVVSEIVARIGEPDVAILHAGGAHAPDLGDAFLTLPAAEATEAARRLGSGAVVPVHVDGWSHYSEGVEEVRREFAAAGLDDRLVVVPPGGTVTL